MSILKFKNPETGAWEKVGIPSLEITPENIGAATIAQVQAAQNSADGAAQAAQNAQNSADSKVPNTRKVNNKQLNADITLTAADVGAATTSAVEAAQTTANEAKTAAATAQSAANGKASMSDILKDSTKTLYGLGTSAIPDDIFNKLSSSILYQEVVTTLADLAEGNTLTINETENGKTSAVPYIIVSKNYSNTGRCLVLRKNCVSGINQYGSNNTYTNSYLDKYCNETHIAKLDPLVQEQIVNVPIQVISAYNNSTITTISRKGFSLSAYELNLNVSSLPVEGQRIPYLTEEKRGSDYVYWTRTRYQSDSSSAYSIATNGNYNHLTRVNNAAAYYRPAFTLPQEFIVNVSPNMTDVLGTPIDMGGIKIETGSYKGTGTYGTSNPVTLTFSFEPKLVMVFSRQKYGSHAVRTLIATPFVNANDRFEAAFNNVLLEGSSQTMQVKWGSNSLSFYATQDPEQQLNYSGGEYKYIAIG